MIKSNTPHPIPRAKVPKVPREMIFKLNKNGIDAITAPVNNHTRLKEFIMI